MHDLLVGYSQGNVIADPGQTDFSAGVFTINQGGTPLLLTGTTLPTLGGTLTLEVDQVTPGSLIGVLVLGLGQVNPGVASASSACPAASCTRRWTTRCRSRCRCR